MAVQKIVIKGKDFQPVMLETPLKDLTKDEKAEVWQFLISQNEQKKGDENSLWSAINKSEQRQRDKTFKIFFDPNNKLGTVEQALKDGKILDNALVETGIRWNGIAGIIHWLYPKDDPKYDITLQISSRFDTDDKNYFLSAMLLSWFDQNTMSLSEDQIHVSMDDVFHFLWVAVFKSQLIKAYETGIYKAYQYFEDNSDRIRGAIDVARHIRLNAGLNNGKIATKYRKNTGDNFMNHLIIHTYLELKRLYPGIVSSVIGGDEHARSVIQFLMFQAPSYTKYDVRTVMSKLRNPISHPFFINYEGLRQTCFKILSYTGISIFDSENSSENDTQSMLFYTPDMWEAYVEGRILPKINTSDITWKSQVQDANLILNMRPDFLLFCNKNLGKEKRIILDAKYKAAWGDFLREGEKNNLEDDIRQCILYKGAFAAEYTGTIFPVQMKNSDQEKIIHNENISTYAPKSFLAVGVRIPPVENESFQSWNQKMQAEEQQIAGNLAQIISTTM